MNGYRCNNCGAELLVNNKNINITTCLYCDSKIAFFHKEYSDYNVKKIIPFSITKEEALKQYFGFNKQTKDVKKVYLPVKFYSCDFSYFIDYTYYKENTYARFASLYDGNIKNDIIAKNTSTFRLGRAFYNAEKKNFDPVLLSDVSIDFSNMVDEKDGDEKKIKNNIKSFFKSKIESLYCINVDNYYLSNVEVDDYVTLIPIYIVKMNDGLIYKIPGVGLNKSSSKRKNTILIDAINFFIILLSILMLFVFYESIFFFVGFILIAFLLYLKVYIGKKILISDIIEDNIECNVYDVSTSSKKFKY